jgi:tRNA-2-methylthio-N6-dimethylallyladenosine synthase
MRKGLYIKTFGCQMNVYDSLKIMAILADEYDSVSTPEEADLIIVNTCSVRDKPQQKVYSLLGEFRKLKERRPKLLVGVGGCVAQQEGERLVRRSEAVDFVFGTHNLSLIPALVKLRSEGAPPQVAVDYRDEWEDLPLGLGGESGVSVPVTISRGCNKRCSYCVVPVTRGPEVSRLAAEIEQEAALLVSRGAREILLLGQTVNSYGRDLTPSTSFEGLLERLSGLDGLARIRFTSPHPQEVGEAFLDLVAGNPKICRHVHMPLQAGSDLVLRRMNRNYTQRRYLDIIEALKKRVPDIAVTTDLIVGFPGESEDDFAQTLAVMEAVEFDASFSFAFSARPGTPAAQMDDQIPDGVKAERLARLQAAQDRISERRLAAWVGRPAEVLLEGPSHSDAACLQGRISQNIVLNLTRSRPALKPGMLVEVEVSGVGRHTLKGDLKEGAGS